MSKGRHGRRGFGRGGKIAAVSLAVLTFAGGASSLAAYRYDRAEAERLLPGVSIEGVDVSGMTRDEAMRAVSDQAEAVLEGDLAVIAAGHAWHVTPAALGMTADIEGAVDVAFAVADRMSFVPRVWHRLRQEPVGASIDLAYAYDDERVRAFVEQAYEEVVVPAVNAKFALREDELVIRGSRVGQALKVDIATERITNALESRIHAVAIPVKPIEPEVTTASLGQTIVIDLSENVLYLYHGLKVMEQYPVATAAPGYSTPVGTWRVVGKREDPGWYNPAPDGWGAGEPLYIPPGPGNPLGTRALYLSAPGIRIHGTYASYSIGSYASHGCIRMYISDSEELYPLVPVGTKVIIKP